MIANNMDMLKFTSLVNDQSYRRKRRRSQQDNLDANDNPSYTAMIAEAIMVTPFKRATLSEIYEYMNKTFDILKKRGTGWRNCVRHTLSLNECFVKLHRPENGRSCNWTVHQAYFEAFLRGDYRKKRANRKKGKSENENVLNSSQIPDITNREPRLRESCSERLGSGVPVTPTVWPAGYNQIDSELTKGNQYQPVTAPSTYSYDQLYDESSDRNKVNGNITAKSEDNTPFTSYNISTGHSYSPLSTQSVKTIPYPEIHSNHDVRPGIPFPPERNLPLTNEVARLPGSYSIDIPQLLRPNPQFPEIASNNNFRPPPAYYPDFSESRNSSQYPHLPTNVVNSSTNAYHENPSTQSSRINGEYTPEVNSNIYPNMTAMRPTIDPQYDTSTNRVNNSPPFDRVPYDRYDLSQTTTNKTTCHSSYVTAQHPVDYNQHSTCQHYGIDPSCYSCFSARSYRQEFF